MDHTLRVRRGSRWSPSSRPRPTISCALAAAGDRGIEPTRSQHPEVYLHVLEQPTSCPKVFEGMGIYSRRSASSSVLA